jgi:hypothetical protein
MGKDLARTGFNGISTPEARDPSQSTKGKAIEGEEP